MCVKMIVSMVLSEVDAGRAQVPVQVVAIVPTASAGRLSEDVPAHVMLPRFVLKGRNLLFAPFFFVHSTVFCVILHIFQVLVGFLRVCSFSPCRKQLRNGLT